MEFYISFAVYLHRVHFVQIIQTIFYTLPQQGIVCRVFYNLQISVQNARTYIACTYINMFLYFLLIFAYRTTSF